MIYYQSNDLSERLEINLSKWKRWVREFLPPDALGGFQSGYARQFTLKEAFRVFLGGVLVGSLKFSVPDAKRILSDLNSFLKAEGFYALRVIEPASPRPDGDYYRVYIYPLPSKKFGYTIRGVRSLSADEEELQNEKFDLLVMASLSDRIASGEAETAWVLGISRLYEQFLSRLAN